MLKRADNWVCDWLDSRVYGMEGWLRQPALRFTLWYWSRFEKRWGHGPMISNQ